MPNVSNCDRRALAVAQTIQEIIAPIDIFLFGSRARGDWNDDSDIDIFTIAERDSTTWERYWQALKAGEAQARSLYGRPVKIDLVRYSPADFAYYRQARTHLTYAALKDGVSMSQEPVGESGRYEEVAPNNWPDVAQRFINYQRQILVAEHLLNSGLSYEEVGQNFQRCLENACKGFLVYLEYDDGARNDWRCSHSLTELQNLIRAFPVGRQILGERDFSFLNPYATDAPYEGVQEPLPDEAGVLALIKETVDAMMRFVENNAGRELPRYSPPGPRP